MGRQGQTILPSRRLSPCDGKPPLVPRAPPSSPRQRVPGSHLPPGTRNCPRRTRRRPISNAGLHPPVSAHSGRTPPLGNRSHWIRVWFWVRIRVWIWVWVLRKHFVTKRGGGEAGSTRGTCLPTHTAYSLIAIVIKKVKNSGHDLGVREVQTSATIRGARTPPVQRFHAR